MENGHPVPITFDLSKTGADGAPAGECAKPEDPSQKGAILWEALVCDSKVRRPDGIIAEHILLRYHDRRPINISQNKQLQATPAQTDTDPSEECTYWSGPVFLVRHRAHGSLPGVTVKYPTGTHVDILQNREVDSWQQSPDDKVRLFSTHKVPPVAAENDVPYWKTLLVIKSPHLYQEVRQMVSHYPGALPRLFVRDVGDSWERELPYMYGPLLHLFPEIQKRVLSSSESRPRRDSHSTKQQESTNVNPDDEFHQDVIIAADHLAILYRHLKPMYESVQADVQKSLAAEKPSIAFGTLWYVFKPGDEVYLKDEWTPWCFARVDAVKLEWRGLSKPESHWSIRVWVLTSDGSRVARYKPYSMKIDYFHGLKELSSLKVCPTAFWDAQQNRERRETALLRGRLLFKALRNDSPSRQLRPWYLQGRARGNYNVLCRIHAD